MSDPDGRRTRPGNPAQQLLDPEIRALGPWYHDFSRLGLRTRFDDDVPRWFRPGARLLRTVADRFRSGRIPKGERLLSRATFSDPSSSHLSNQPVKESVLLPLIESTLAGFESPRCLDLFCADGYYSCTMATLHPTARITAVDLDDREIRRARAAARALELGRLEFLQRDVTEFVSSEASRYSFVLCAGGLYHLERPQALLRDLRPIVERYLLVQSVVSLEHEEEDYFESPAPGWSHGSRFSHRRLRSWLLDLGWSIEVEVRNELPGNRRPRDRGSSYFLCRAPEKGEQE